MRNLAAASSIVLKRHETIECARVPPIFSRASLRKCSEKARCRGGSGRRMRSISSVHRTASAQADSGADLRLAWRLVVQGRSWSGSRVGGMMRYRPVGTWLQHARGQGSENDQDMSEGSSAPCPACLEPDRPGPPDVTCRRVKK